MNIRILTTYIKMGKTMVMWTNYFLKTMEFGGKIFKKEKLQHKCGILPQTSS